MLNENEHTLKDILSDMVDSMKWKERLQETQIRKIWMAKMGTTINQHTRDINLRKQKLYISIESASLKQELSYEREKIMDMFNRELGGSYIDSVIIR